jgi:hypothetical protein
MVSRDPEGGKADAKLMESRHLAALSKRVMRRRSIFQEPDERRAVGLRVALIHQRAAI